MPVKMVSDHTPARIRGLAGGAGAWLNWLAENSEDLREAVAHQRRVRDNELYKTN